MWDSAEAAIPSGPSSSSSSLLLLSIVVVVFDA
jgi:hypothetical protein